LASKPGKPHAGLAAGIAAISFGAIFTRLAASPAPAVAALRMVFASLVLAPFALGNPRVRKELRGLSRREAALVGLAGSFLALHFILWISSLSFTGVTASVVFVTTNPLWVALFTIVVLRRDVPRGFWPGLALAIAGGIVIGGADAVGNAARLKGDLLALGGAAAVAGYFLAGARLRERLSLLAYVVPVYSVAGVLLAAGALVAKVPLAGYRWESYAYCLAMALVCQIAGHSLFNWALKHLPTPVVAMASLGEPVGATVLALLILGEAPRRSDVGGGVLILAGILVVMAGSRIVEPRRGVASAS
jgi:drug/metabolite transporter (DMT)-like permease